MNKPWLRYGLGAAGCGVFGLVVFDLGRAIFTTNPPLDRAAMKSRIPADVLDPSTGAVRLSGDDLQTFLHRPALQVGGACPSLQMADYRHAAVSIPAADGRPTICVVSCGCQKCVRAIYDGLALKHELGSRIHVVAVVATRSNYAWGHHAGTFALKPEISLVHDEDGRYLRLIRVPGKDPTKLPVVWACDGKGVVRYTAQPELGDNWVRPAKRSLRLTSALAR